MDKEPTFYEEDGNEICDAITYMMEHKSVPSMDLNLEDGKTARVFWQDNVLHFEIKGLR